MKVVVVGGAGRVGALCVQTLDARGVQVASASRRTGVDLITGAGLEPALEGADVVVDVANSPSYGDDVALPFFESATRNLLAAEASAGVLHHIGVSVVGAERLSGSGYFRAKLAQEEQVRADGIAFTILRSTQFFEFLPQIVRDSAVEGVVRLPPARVQFIAAGDVGAALADLAVGRPLRGVVEVAGPDSDTLDALVRAYMGGTGDSRAVIADPEALYYGARLTNQTLMAGDIPRFGHTDFAAWLRRTQRTAAAA